MPWLTIVGVVENVKQAGLDQQVGTEIYYRYGQAGAVIGSVPRTMSTVVLSREPGADLAAALRQAVWELDPSLPVARLRTLEETVAGSVSRPRLLALLLSLFAGAALFLAAIGIYGVMSYSVAQRGRELGIRMAMGANRTGILRLVLSQGLLLTLLGLASGLGLALLSSRILASLLFGVGPSDPLTYGGVALVLFTVGLAACALPALRATRLDPLVVLRHE
jgi:putative ABC transport system permease protein